jgi:hypothetical protein
MRCRQLVAGFALLTAAGMAAPAAAWGPEGHAIVADIAEAHLTATTKSQIAQLLALDSHSHLDEVSSWPDEIRGQRPNTAPWHFVDIPLDAPGYDAARDCAGGNCAVAKIVDFEKVLADKSAAPQARLEALKWVVHFVGDIHQPLHAEDHDDKGGNTIHLSFFGKETNLHAVWDGGIIERAEGLKLGPNYSFDHDAVQTDAGKLDAMIAPADRAAWAPANMTATLDRATITWANESHALAHSVAYPDLPSDRSGEWADTYEQKTWPVVEGQLERAGVRLAELLNEALR